MTAYIDITPTLLNLIGYENTIDFDGIDIWPSIEGETLPERYIFLGNSGIVGQEWKMNQGELFRIEDDKEEQHDLASENPEVVQILEELISAFHEMRPDAPVEKQPEGWLPPGNWTMPE